MEKNVKAIKCGLLIDGTGEEPVKDAVVLIEGSRVSVVGDASVPEGAEVIDASDMTVMPGLIDVHMHLNNDSSLTRVERYLDFPSAGLLRAVRNAWKNLEAGVTSVGNVGWGLNWDDLALRAAIEKGVVRGSRILASGRNIGPTASHGDMFMPITFPRPPGATVDGADEVRKTMREIIRAGPDFIKTATTGGVGSSGDEPWWRNWTQEEIDVIVDEAHAVKKAVQSHAEGSVGVKSALAAGVDQIEHGFEIDDDDVEVMLKQGTFLFPTLGIVDMIVHGERAKRMEPHVLRKASTWREIHIKSFERAHQAGVKITMGTDASSVYPHGENAKELEYLVKHGMTPMETIVASSKTAAESFYLEDEMGTIEEGRLADLLIVDGNPLNDITVLQNKARIKVIMKDGRIEIDRRP